jgi:UPF0042 nucleotide-binding protein
MLNQTKPTQTADLLAVSGLSGSGKSIALKTLEDLGYYCIDNIPPGLLETVVASMSADQGVERLAIGIDARSCRFDETQLPKAIAMLRRHFPACRLLFLCAEQEVLLKRYRETRRKHPLLSPTMGLHEALALEEQLLAPVRIMADYLIDTSRTTIHTLRKVLTTHFARSISPVLTLQSFGFKYGMPLDADFLFDVRCIPNPHWDPQLRPFTGLDDVVAQHLAVNPVFMAMRRILQDCLEGVLPHCLADGRLQIHAAMGCTGGQHRSVAMVEALAVHFRQQQHPVDIWHRELPDSQVELYGPLS